MAFEPKIEHFMQELSYEESNLLGNHREETFWYLDEAHLSVVVQEFDQLPEEKQHIAVNNLARIYPLSKPLLHHLLVRLPKSDHDFIMGFDLLDAMIPDLQGTLRWVRERTGSATEQFSNCMDDLERLRRERQKLQEEAQRHQEYRKEKAELEREIEKLRKENDSAEQKKTIEKLNQEERKLRDDIKSKKDDEDKKRKTLGQLKKELQQLNQENRITEPKVQRDLSALLKQFPKDAEDGK